MPPAQRSKNNSQQQPRRWLDHLLVYATIAAAISAATAAGIGGWQAYLTRQNNIVSQRAFVYVEGPEIVHVISKTTGEPGVNIFIAMKNSGNTATKDLSVYFRCATSTDVLAEPWVLLYREKTAGLPQIIGPNQTVRSVCFFSKTQLKQMNEDKLHGYLMGEIVYRDRLDSGNLHRTQASFALIDLFVADAPKEAPPGTKGNILIGFVPTGQHNCADEDCPQ